MGKPLLQIVLFGQKELDMKLYQDKFKQLKQRISFSYEIRALRRREVGVYMEYRLMVAGMQGRSIFQQDAIDLIARFTQGVPRNINIIAHKAMLFAQAGQSLDVRSHHVWKALYDHGLVSYTGLLKQWKLGFFLSLLVINLGLLYGLVHLYYSSTGGLVEPLTLV